MLRSTVDGAPRYWPSRWYSQPRPFARTKSARGYAQESWTETIGSSYILTAEADVQKKLNEARTRFQQLNYASCGECVRTRCPDQKALVRELTQQQILLNQQLQRNLPAFEHNQLVAAVNEVTGRLNLLRAEAADPT